MAGSDKQALARCAELRDLEEIMRVAEEAFPGGGYPRHAVRQFHDLFAESFFVIGEAGRLRAFALFAPKTPYLAWFLALGVEDCSRGQGLGEALSAHGTAHFRRLGFKEIRLTVSPDNTARRLYARQGYRMIAHETAYYGPDTPRDVMALTLT